MVDHSKVYMKEGKWKNLSSDEYVSIGHLKNSTMPSTKVIASVCLPIREHRWLVRDLQRSSSSQENETTKNQTPVHFCLSYSLLPGSNPKRDPDPEVRRWEVNQRVDCAFSPLQGEFQVFPARGEGMIIK